MENWIVCLARVFSEEKYAQEFINRGKFRCNTLNFFKNYKDEFLNNIGDEHEGIISIFKPEDGVELKIKDPTTDNWHIITDYTDLKFHSSSILTTNIFCMYAPSIKKDKKYSIEEIEEIVKLPKESENLGNHLVVITKPDIFFERLIKEVVESKNFKLRKSLVLYQDFSKSFSLTADMVGFVKSDEFIHQKEYRIMIDTVSNEDIHLDLEIGSLSDIAILIPTEDFNSSYKVALKNEVELENII